jgi:hypothetical protein
MFVITKDKSIYLTRGDVALIVVSAQGSNGVQHTFVAGDVVRLKVFERKGCDCVVIQKDVVVEAETTEVTIYLEKDDTKIGEIIHKPKDYWYEIELNPDTAPQTIVGYDDDGAKVFRLYPEGGEDNE